MNLPSVLQGESRVRLLQGACVGAVLAVVIGFNWGGWQLSSKAERMADQRATSAVIGVLAPICVNNFQHASEARTTLMALQATESWKKETFVVDGGWATFPGNGPNRGVARACAKLLGELK